MKRFLALVLAVLMCTSAFAFNVSAAETATVTLKAATTQVNAGDTVTIQMYIQHSAVANSFGIRDFTVKDKDGIDSTAIAFDSFGDAGDEAVDALFNVADNNTKVITVGYMTKLTLNSTKVFYNINFKVADDAQPGKYTISGTGIVKDGPNEFEVTNVPATIEVKGKDFGAVTMANKEVTYDGNAVDPKDVMAPSVANPPATDTVDYTYTVKKNGSDFTDPIVDAGTYDVTVVANATGYSESAPKTATLTVKPKEAIVAVSFTEKVYDGTTAVKYRGNDPQISLEGIIDADKNDVVLGGTLEYTSKDAGAGIPVKNNFALTGDRAFNYVIAYNGFDKADISKKDITVTGITTKVLLNRGTIPTGADLYTYDTNDVCAGDAFTGAVKTSAKNNVVGEYPVEQGTLSLGNNYNINFVNGMISVVDRDPQTLIYTADKATSFVYGSVENFNVKVESDPAVDAGDKIETGKPVVYSSDNEEVATVDANGAVTVINKAGIANIKAFVEGDEAANIADFEEVITVTVAQKEIPVTIKADASMYKGDDAAKHIGYTYDDALLVSGDGAVFTGELEIKGNVANVGTYVVEPGTVALSDNYKLVFTNGKIEVKQNVAQAGVVVVSNLNPEYAQTGVTYKIDMTETYEGSVATFVSSDTAVVDIVNGELVFKKPGTAQITASIDKSADFKYLAFTSAPVTITVKKQNVEIEVDDYYKKTGAAEPAYTYTITKLGTVETDVANGTYGVTISRDDTAEDIKAYDLKVDHTAFDPVLYNVTVKAGKLNITEKDVPTYKDTGKVSVVYGSNDTKLTTAVDAQGEFTYTYASSDEAVVEVAADGTLTAKKAGTAKITVTVDENADFASVPVNVEVEVTPKALTVTDVNLDEKTAVLDGVVGEDDVKVDFNKLTVTKGADVDELTTNITIDGFVLTGTAAANYTVTGSVNKEVDKADLVNVTVAATTNGTVAGAGTYLKGFTVTLTATPDAGYVTKTTSTGVISGDTITFTAEADVEVTVTFAVKTSTPIYGGGGGGGGSTSKYVTLNTGDGTTTKVKIDKDGKIILPDDPTRDGFTFAGWYLDKDCTVPFDQEEKLTKSITIYAKWEEVPKVDDGEDGDTADEWTNPYVDVKDDEWFIEAVKVATQNGWMNGTGADTFAPYDKFTRAMLVTVLYRIDGGLEVDGTVDFTDVDLNDYYGDALIWAFGNGIVKGITDELFGANIAISREQIATMLYRYAQFKGYDVSAKGDLASFADAGKVSDYAVDALTFITGAGVISGRPDGTIDPLADASRAEVATMLMRFMNAVEAK